MVVQFLFVLNSAPFASSRGARLASVELDINWIVSKPAFTASLRITRRLPEEICYHASDGVSVDFDRGQMVDSVDAV